MSEASDIERMIPEIVNLKDIERMIPEIVNACSRCPEAGPSLWFVRRERSPPGGAAGRAAGLLGRGTAGECRRGGGEGSAERAERAPSGMHERNGSVSSGVSVSRGVR